MIAKSLLCAICGQNDEKVQNMLKIGEEMCGSDGTLCRTELLYSRYTTRTRYRLPVTVDLSL